eukprot:EG_transcript_19936
MLHIFSSTLTGVYPSSHTTTEGPLSTMHFLAHRAHKHAKLLLIHLNKELALLGIVAFLLLLLETIQFPIEIVVDLGRGLFQCLQKKLLLTGQFDSNLFLKTCF